MVQLSPGQAGFRNVDKTKSGSLATGLILVNLLILNLDPVECFG